MSGADEATLDEIKRLSGKAETIRSAALLTGSLASCRSSPSGTKATISSHYIIQLLQTTVLRTWAKWLSFLQQVHAETPDGNQAGPAWRRDVQIITVQTYTTNQYASYSLTKGSNQRWDRPTQGTLTPALAYPCRTRSHYGDHWPTTTAKTSIIGAS